jgi:hypothetical protein
MMNVDESSHGVYIDLKLFCCDACTKIHGSRGRRYRAVTVVAVTAI